MSLRVMSPEDTAATVALRAACASRRRTVGLLVPSTGLRGWACML